MFVCVIVTTLNIFSLLSLVFQYTLHSFKRNFTVVLFTFRSFFLLPGTRLECFLRDAKILATNLRGLKITRTIRGYEKKNKGCETIISGFPVPERIRGGNFLSHLNLTSQTVRDRSVLNFLKSKFYKGGNDAHLFCPPYFNKRCEFFWC